MVITYHGVAFCKVSQGDTTIAFAPISKGASRTVSKSGSDIALVPHASPDFSGVESVTLGTKVPFVIDGPGEYEVGGVAIRGFETAGPEGTRNTLYSVLWDDIVFCHTGAYGGGDLSARVIEDLPEVDVLILPLSYAGAPSTRDFVRLVKHVEPKIILPLADTPHDPVLATFIKESGIRVSDPQEKFTFKRRDLDGKNGESVILSVS